MSKVERIPEVEIPREQTAEYKLRRVLGQYVPPLTKEQVEEIVEKVVYEA